MLATQGLKNRASESSGSAASLVSANELQRAVVDLQTTEPLPGLIKTLTLGLFCGLFLTLALTTTHPWLFLFWGICAGASFGAWIITTHDAIHHTLTGWKWFDEIEPRLIFWPVIWVHGTYGEIHKLHHKMNGDDVTDPERVQWTQEEFEGASAWGRFYVRHQWFLDIFVFGGIGLIYKTVGQGFRFYRKSKGLRRQMWMDLVGIVSTNVLLYSYAASQGVALKWFALWLVMERVGGGLMQWRAHIEHYGLWGKGRHYFETQVYNCRNIRTSGLVSWYFNHLNFHSVHHAFPRVPFYKLKTAHQRFMALYNRPGVEALNEVDGYLRSSLSLATHPCVIGRPDPSSPHGARSMVMVKGNNFFKEASQGHA